MSSVGSKIIGVKDATANGRASVAHHTAMTVATASMFWPAVESPGISNCKTSTANAGPTKSFKNDVKDKMAPVFLSTDLYDVVILQPIQGLACPAYRDARN